MKVIVLNAKNYNFKNSEDETVKGLKLSYITDDYEQSESSFGFPVIQQSISQQDLKSMGIENTGLYDIDFSFKPGKGNIPIVQVSNVKFIKKIDLENLFK
ncbi:TPA: hypothetical protein I9Z34_003056 [Clostridium perfringens]|nr:hypothetical protein [Clostridium perfringens]